MNPLILIGFGLVAAAALGGRRTRTASQDGGGGDGGDGGKPERAPKGEPATPGGLVIPLSKSGKPKPNTFYQVSAADLEANRELIDSISSLAIYGSPTYVSSLVTDYARCINRSQWNAYYYGVEATGNNVVDGLSAELAFEKQNPNAIKALQSGRWPAKYAAFGPTIPPSMRNSYGLLWLPAIQEDVDARAGMGAPPNQIVCPATGLNPPASLLESLTGTPPPWWTNQGGGYA